MIYNPENLKARLSDSEYNVYIFIQKHLHGVNKDMIYSESDLHDEEIEEIIKKLEDEVLIYREGGDNWYSTYFKAFDKDKEE